MSSTAKDVIPARAISPRESKVFAPVDVIGAIAEYLHDNVSLPEHLGARLHNLRSLVAKLNIGVARVQACILFNHYLKSGLDQSRNDHRNQSNASLSWIRFFGHANNHKLFLPGLSPG
jgi:hypothetical protein